MVKKIANILVDIVIVLLVVIIIFNIFFIPKDEKKHLPDLFGYKFLIDLTNSMIPEISSGDLIIIKQKNSYHKGDIVTYRDQSDVLITHRIIAVKNTNGEKIFQIQGDNNASPDDEEVTLSQIEGVYVKRIPVLGEICLFLTSIYGIAFLIILVIIYITYLIAKKRLN